MSVIKKIIFLPLFVAFTASLLFFYKPLLDKYLEIFFTAYAGLYEFGLLAGLIIFSSLSYCLYLTFTQNIRFTFGPAIAASAIPFLFLKTELAFVIGCGF
jgi:putative effector of murein hydrolase